jgi:hypothetical protein
MGATSRVRGQEGRGGKDKRERRISPAKARYLETGTAQVVLLGT